MIRLYSNAYLLPNPLYTYAHRRLRNMNRYLTENHVNSATTIPNIQKSATPRKQTRPSSSNKKGGMLPQESHRVTLCGEIPKRSSPPSKANQKPKCTHAIVGVHMALHTYQQMH